MPPTAQRLKFGDFEFDEATGELWRNGDRVVLPNQPSRILALLIRRAGTLVTRDELRRELWPDDTFVDFEHSLNAGVRRLRDAIGDSASSPRFIETMPQRGYRFIGGVQPASDPVSTLRDRLSRWPVVSAAALIALTFLLFAFHGTYAVDRAPNRTLVRLTSTSGLNTDPALSPDGTLVAYASDRAGGDRFDIYVQRAAGGDAMRLTTDPAEEREPSFAPDGASIVFARRGSGLYVAGVFGGEPRLILKAAGARTPRFSPDGRWICYWTGFPASVVAGGVPGALGSIFVVPAEGGEGREIRTHLASARYPVWSPDGEQILFLGEENSDRKSEDWYVIPRNGGTAVKTEAVDALRAAGLRASFPIPGAWSARRHEVVFATNETDNSNVWQIPISPTSGRVEGRPERLTFGTAVERNPVIANSGRIAFTSIVENVAIWRVPVDTKNGEATGPVERITDGAAGDSLRDVSANGKQVFFISSRTKRDEVWVKDLATGRERQLTHTGVEEASASPDGSMVAFSTSANGKRHIGIVSTAGGLPSILCDDCVAPAGWSRDGKRLLYTASNPFRVVLYDLTSHQKRELVRHPTWSLQRARFSPDDQWVTFHTANSPNVRQIYSASARSGESVPQRSWIPVVTDHGCHPSWASNGTLLYYFSSRDGAFCPWVQRVDLATERPVGPPHAVLHLHHPRLRAASGAAAFDDVEAGYLYMTLTEATGNIWMIEPPTDPASAR